MNTPNEIRHEVIVESLDDINAKISDLSAKLEFYIEELKGADEELLSRLIRLEDETSGYDP